MARLMTAKELAAYLGVAEQTLANWRYVGRGPRFYRVGQLVKYRRGDVDRWLEERAQDPEPAA